MTKIESLVQKLKEKEGITLNPPASFSDIEEFEAELQLKLPIEILEFYNLCNGFETYDWLFRVIPLQEIIKYKNELETNRFFFAEYMIYADIWEVRLSSTGNQEYQIVNYNHKTEEPVTLTNSFVEFIERYLDGGGVLGKQGLYKWYEQNKLKK